MTTTTPDSEGLHAIANTTEPDIQADIVFVHGLAGGSHSTWRYGKEGDKDHFFWPEALGKDLPRCAIWSLGYAAGLGHWFSEEGMAIEDKAANLALKLSNGALGNRPLVFIAYSMGGLVVKTFLTEAISQGGHDWTAVASGVRGVVFLGTPHHGSSMASVAKGFAVLLRTQEHFKQMRFAGPELDALHRRFVKWRRQFNCAVESYIETKGIARNGWFARFFLPSVLVVPRISGDPGLDACTCHPIAADHISLVKPRGPDSDVYLGVKRFIEKTLYTVATPGSIPAPTHAVVVPTRGQWFRRRRQRKTSPASTSTRRLHRTSGASLHHSPLPVAARSFNMGFHRRFLVFAGQRGSRTRKR